SRSDCIIDFIRSFIWSWWNECSSLSTLAPVRFRPFFSRDFSSRAKSFGSILTRRCDVSFAIPFSPICDISSGKRKKEQKSTGQEQKCTCLPHIRSLYVLPVHISTPNKPPHFTAF